MRARSTAERILLCAIGVTVALIFLQSLLPPSVSSNESGWVRTWLAAIFPTDTAFGAFLYHNVRKIAHFAEYAVLGGEVGLYLGGRGGARRWLHCACFGFFVAFADETLQIFSSRGPAIADVWLDLSGFLSAFLLLRALLAWLCRVRRTGA